MTSCCVWLSLEFKKLQKYVVYMINRKLQGSVFNYKQKLYF
jgi:hypothetical protein